MSSTIAGGLVCPHCGERLHRWQPPPEASWTGEQRVCINDDCPYYAEGWKWMEEHYGVRASYRYKLDPATGHGGALPVNSPAVLVNDVEPIDEENP